MQTAKTNYIQSQSMNILEGVVANVGGLRW